jgi:hypothetical protein
LLSVDKDFGFRRYNNGQQPTVGLSRQLTGSGRFQNAPRHCSTLVRRRWRGNRRRGSGSNGWLCFHGGTWRCGWNHRRAAAGTRLNWRTGHRCTNQRVAATVRPIQVTKATCDTSTAVTTITAAARGVTATAPATSAAGRP